MGNVISLVGRVGQVKELKAVGDSSVLEFSVANDVGWGDRKTTNWFQVKVWGKSASGLQPYIEKGKQLFITGELTIREYENKEGVKCKSVEINQAKVEFVGSKADNSGGGEPAPSQDGKPGEDGEMPF